MGRRPVELTEAETAEVETLAAVLSTEQIADYFGIGRRTFWDLMARDPAIAARYKRGKARAIGAIAQGLITKARSGDTASMIFFLKTQGGWRETAAVEHQGQVDLRTRSDQGFARFAALLDREAMRAIGRSGQAGAGDEAVRLPGPREAGPFGERTG